MEKYGNFSSPDNKKDKIVPNTEKLEASILSKEKPFEMEFNSFKKGIRSLPADYDVVSGIPREYVATSKLQDIYTQTFRESGLSPSSIIYRIKNIDPNKYPDDFIVLPTESAWEHKYFINRKNDSLLREIYLPDIPKELKEIIQNVKMMEEDHQSLEDISDRQEILKILKNKNFSIEDEEFHDENEYLNE